MPSKEIVVPLGLCLVALLGFIGIGGWWTEMRPIEEKAETRAESDLGTLEIMARLEPTKVMNFKRLGEAYKASGQLREAVSAYVTASELAPGDPEVQRALINLRAMAEARGRH
ncbi:MAG: hypothetical protein P8N43_02510 [Alphaproteobacteria bacterium]|nr:hypothetical protein [Alphaproteobacteria bacterium]